MQLGDSCETVLEGGETHEGHVAVGGTDELQRLDLAVLLEDVAQGLLLAELLAERRDVDRARRGVHGDRLVRGESE